jgi:hypothetical protein
LVATPSAVGCVAVVAAQDGPARVSECRCGLGRCRRSLWAVTFGWNPRGRERASPARATSDAGGFVFKGKVACVDGAGVLRVSVPRARVLGTVRIVPRLAVVEAKVAACGGWQWCRRPISTSTTTASSARAARSRRRVTVRGVAVTVLGTVEHRACRVPVARKPVGVCPGISPHKHNVNTRPVTP